MAGLTFLDLLFAEALVSGLARERRAERPPPDNFFVLSNDPRAWRQIQIACKKENMVIAVEITDNRNENCRRVQSLFVDLAREFDGAPFLRATISLGNSFEELRKDLGGVQYTPTILIIWYGDDSVFRAKHEGEGEIKQGLASGRIQGVLKEFLERRVKLKLAEHMAEQLADHVASEMSERERRIRSDYEEKLRREMTEKAEARKKEEEEERQKEEEEEKQKEEQRRKVQELRRKSRPQHLEELMKLNLDTAPIREVKAIMIKMGISPHDCVERSDLKKKLMDNVPELRIEMERRSRASRASISSTNTGRSDSVSSASSFAGSGMNDLNDPLGASNQAQDFGELLTLRRKLNEKDAEIRDLKMDLQKMTARANSAEGQVLTLKAAQKPVPKPRARSIGGGGGGGRVKELELQLLETRMLYTTTIEEYKVLGLIHDSGEEGIVLRAQCTRPGIPNPDRVYAMKVLTNYFQTQTVTQARVSFQNEYQVLCQLPPHENIIHMYAFFFDRANPDVSPEFKRVGRNVRTMSLFLLMDEHPINMEEQLNILVENQGPKPGKVVCWLRDLLRGLAFLESHHIVHRDLKMANLLMDSSGRVVISDFGKAIVLDETMKIPYHHGYDIGGNRAHLCPEILNAKPGPRNMVSYTKQPVWAAGVLAYEFAGHRNPFESGTHDQRGYLVDQLPPLKFTYCKNSKFCQPLQSDFTSLVKRMLEMEASDRPSLQTCLARAEGLN